MKINSDVKPVKFTGEGEHEHSSISVARSNLCELYRDGISFTVENGDNHFSVLLKVSEVERLGGFLNLYTNNSIIGENRALKQKIKDAENCLVCAAIGNPLEVVQNTLDILKS